MRLLIFVSTLLIVMACGMVSDPVTSSAPIQIETTHEPRMVLLGTIQDAGIPHIACQKSCCTKYHDEPDPTLQVASLGIIDSEGRSYMIDATPDFTHQYELLKTISGEEDYALDGIFLTHAHMGHYTGLMYLGREAMGAFRVPVYAMPRMADYLREDGPWSQLVQLQNISIREIAANDTIRISPELRMVPLLVPHRDEYSETVGFKIIGPSRSALYVPDIDKWTKWELDISEEISAVDYAFVDATFYDGAEINHRDVSEIPHPFVIESMELFGDLPDTERSKVIFTHLNHTNPLIDPDSPQTQHVIDQGYHIGRWRQVFTL